MKKTSFLIAAALALLTCSSVFAKPTKVLKSKNTVLACYPCEIYKNKVAVVVNVNLPEEYQYPLSSFESEPGLKYVYTVKYPSGRIEDLYTIYSKSTDVSVYQIKPRVGMYYFWTPVIPSSNAFSKKEKRYVPYIMTSDCLFSNQVDAWVPSSEIPGF